MGGRFLLEFCTISPSGFSAQDSTNACWFTVFSYILHSAIDINLLISSGQIPCFRSAHITAYYWAQPIIPKALRRRCTVGTTYLLVKHSDFSVQCGCKPWDRIDGNQNTIKMSSIPSAFLEQACVSRIM